MMLSDRRRGVLGAACVLFVFIHPWSPPARAADTDEAGARVLFAEARRLVAAGNYAEACPKFEASLRLDAGVGTNFNLADCMEHTGRIASAWARFLDVAAATRLAGQPEREQVARDRAAALEPRLAHLTVQVAAPAPGLVVERDDVSLPPSSWGVAVPIDPGAHAIKVTRAGEEAVVHRGQRARCRRRVAVRAGARGVARTAACDHRGRAPAANPAAAATARLRSRRRGRVDRTRGARRRRVFRRAVPAGELRSEGPVRRARVRHHGRARPPSGIARGRIAGQNAGVRRGGRRRRGGGGRWLSLVAIGKAARATNTPGAALRSIAGPGADSTRQLHGRLVARQGAALAAGGAEPGEGQRES